jgi:hypothetical protein
VVKLADTPAPARQTTTRPRVRKTSPRQRVPLLLPIYAYDDIKERALNAGSTAQYIILQALRKGGIAIKDEDLVEDGRRLR